MVGGEGTRLYMQHVQLHRFCVWSYCTKTLCITCDCMCTSPCRCDDGAPRGHGSGSPPPSVAHPGLCLRLLCLDGACECKSNVRNELDPLKSLSSKFGWGTD